MMTEEENRLTRLRWALRYILIHPDMSPAIMEEEWEISRDDAIEICSKNFGLVVGGFGIKNGDDMAHYEKEIFRN